MMEKGCKHFALTVRCLLTTEPLQFFVENDGIHIRVSQMVFYVRVYSYSVGARCLLCLGRDRPFRYRLCNSYG